MYEQWTDDAILRELGNRLRQARLNENISREALAKQAGVSLGTLRNAELGNGSSMTTYLRVMRALGIVDRIEALLPAPEPSPLQLLQLRGESRTRASSRGSVTQRES